MSTYKAVAIVTGSAQGIGQSIALRLASDGFDIGLNDIPAKYEELCAVADEVKKTGRRSVVVAGDVSIEEEVERMVEEVVKELGSLDVVSTASGARILADSDLRW